MTQSKWQNPEICLCKPWETDDGGSLRLGSRWGMGMQSDVISPLALWPKDRLKMGQVALKAFGIL